MSISNPVAATLLLTLGHRLSQQRIAAGLTQAELANKAGVGKRTLERLENGESIQLNSFLKLLAALQLSETFLNAIPDQQNSPMQQLRQQSKPRQRARASKPANPKAAMGIAEPKPSWQWGEDQ